MHGKASQFWIFFTKTGSQNYCIANRLPAQVAVYHLHYITTLTLFTATRPTELHSSRANWDISFDWHCWTKNKTGCVSRCWLRTLTWIFLLSASRLNYSANGCADVIFGVHLPIETCFIHAMCNLMSEAVLCNPPSLKYFQQSVMSSYSCPHFSGFPHCEYQKTAQSVFNATPDCKNMSLRHCDSFFRQSVSYPVLLFQGIRDC